MLIKNLLVISSLVTLSSIALARDLGPDEALKLRDAGSIQAFEKLNQQALALHPGGTIRETELEEEMGRYIYTLELVDAQGLEWDIELDATTGDTVQNHQDD